MFIYRSYIKNINSISVQSIMGLVFDIYLQRDRVPVRMRRENLCAIINLVRFTRPDKVHVRDYTQSSDLIRFMIVISSSST